MSAPVPLELGWAGLVIGVLGLGLDNVIQIKEFYLYNL